MDKQQITTITFFRFEEFHEKWWAFGTMGKSPKLLKEVPGMVFGKMLGSGGGNGFSIFPNLGVYGLLACWEDKGAADNFMTNHPTFRALEGRSTEYWTLSMKNIKSHGKWEGQSPFQETSQPPSTSLSCVITRATIHSRQLLNFWQYVPRVSRSMEGKPGLLFAMGIGELPLIQQATFSVWENMDQMKAYAYESSYHKEVVKQTRKRGWYKEELFARFFPIEEKGAWAGKRVLS